jgi:hypothetical protein
MSNKSCRSEFQHENLKLSNRINSGEFDRELLRLIPVTENEIALVLLLVRKAQNNRTSNAKRAKQRDNDLLKLQVHLETRLQTIKEGKGK